MADTAAASPGLQALGTGGSLYLDSTGAAAGGAPGAGAGIATAGGGSATAPSTGILGTIGQDVTSAGQSAGSFISSNLPSWLGGTSGQPAAGFPNLGGGLAGEQFPEAVGAPGAQSISALASSVPGTVGGAAAPAAAGAGGGLIGAPGSFTNEITRPGSLLGIAGLGYEALKGHSDNA